jgi:hypothetical protein
MDRLRPNNFSPLQLISWRRDRRNTRLGFAAVDLPTASGLLEIRDVVISQNSGVKFVSMPAGSYISGGQAHYTTILKWDDIVRFRDAVIAAVERCDPEAFESGEPALRESSESEWPS